MDAISYAKKYLEDTLSFFGLNTDVQATSSDGEVIELSVPTSHLNAFLIGHNGETIHSLQFIIAAALRNQNFEMTRVNVDIADYKKARAARLSERAQEWVKTVKETGDALELEPMNAADRRTVHQAVSQAGLATESVGEGRSRHIIIQRPTQ